ncbi:MAG TPA: sulfotransferase [Verrucomicrobiae bacterium]|jgi:tetratricopeptide (TPR) repeat protein|nr:sulfotransferase [Verrucomicrobiae bacterium]
MNIESAVLMTDLAKLQRQPREIARWQKAQQQLMAGRYAAALSAYHDLLKQYPGVAQLWFESAMAEGRDLNFAEAETALEHAATAGANDVPLLVLIGQEYFRLRRFDRARASFQRAVAAEPDSVHALLSMAAWWERERRLNDAMECVETCLSRHPQEPQALYYRAFLLHRQERNDDAAATLSELNKRGNFDTNLKVSINHLLGVVMDALGQYDEAWLMLGEAKALAKSMTDIDALLRDYSKWDRWRRDLLATLTPETIRVWRAESNGPARMAFLGGHPRSGTTLMEQILAAHPDIRAFDEPEAFPQEVLNVLCPAQTTRGLTLSDLSALSATRRTGLRGRYFKSLMREVAGGNATELLLDKNPSPTNSLHLWLRLFPELKVIIALRDPRDVVLSCYLQNLPLNPATANFLSIERTTKHYADLMDVWTRLRELGGFDWIEMRYHEVVANPEGEGRRLTEFLGLQWHPQQAHHSEIAGKKILHSPTYFEAAKPIYKQKVDRWRNYASVLEPVQQRLAPYCRAFGYELK